MNQSSNVENYSYDELLQILGITTLNPTTTYIESVSEKLINKLTIADKMDLVELVQRAKEKLITEFTTKNNAAEMQQDWYKNEYPSQTNKVQLDKITDATYLPLVNELKGDVFAATGRASEAKALYQEARLDAKKRGVTNLFLDMKMNEN